MSKAPVIGAVAFLGLAVAGGIVALDSEVSDTKSPVPVVEDVVHEEGPDEIAHADLWVCGPDVKWGLAPGKARWGCKCVVKKGHMLLKALRKKCKPCKVTARSWGQCPRCVVRGDCESVCQ